MKETQSNAADEKKKKTSRYGKKGDVYSLVRNSYAKS